MPDKLCWLNVGPGGTFEKSGDISSTAADVDFLLGEGLTGSNRLVLHFHGGLVSEARGKTIAEEQAANYGNVASSIGIIWESQITEVLQDRLTHIHSRRAFRKALAWIAARLEGILGLVESARGGEPAFGEAAAIEQMLESEEGVQRLHLRLSVDAAVAHVFARGADDSAASLESLALEFEMDLATDPELVTLVETGAEGGAAIRGAIVQQEGERAVSVAGIALFLAKVARAVIGRYREGTNHDAYPTIVEELLRAAYLADVGKFAWDDMKIKVRAMWRDDGPKPGSKGHVGGYLLRGLEALQERRPNVTIDLVGHSAGSIAICHMLAAIKTQKRAIKIRNILFLAPAVRLDIFAAEVVRMPGRFERFRMFTMEDDWERADKLVPILYTHSLLFFISGVLEGTSGVALAGLARHIQHRTTSAGAGFDDVRAWLAQENRLVTSPSLKEAPEGMRTRSAKHGDFDNDGPTLASLLYLAGRS